MQPAYYLSGASRMDKLTLRMIFARYLMASFLYYIWDEQSPWSDEEYDRNARLLLVQWDNWEHQHKYLINKEDLGCGTLYMLRDYPLIVQSAAWQWQREEGEGYRGDE